jgi:hypothetical protein
LLEAGHPELAEHLRGEQAPEWLLDLILATKTEEVPG